MGFSKLSEIITYGETHQMPFWQVILEDDCRERNVSEKQSLETMEELLEAMEHADAGYDKNLRSAGGMAGGDGEKLAQLRQKGDCLVGPFLSQVMEKAVKMGESNACMRRIVAMPTAGSCGVIPAVLLTYYEQKQVDRKRLLQALYVAGGIGEVLAASASISGAEGGCQAEIGSACAMAAGALSFLEGGDATCICHSAALALKNMLGLVCDPVAGLVEVPCIKRNSFGAVSAVVAAQLAAAGVRSAIPPDEVIDSMRRIGKELPKCLKETSMEGLAVTPTAQEIAKRSR